MKNRLLFLLRTFIFWVALFVVAKVVFLVYEFHMTSQIAPSLWLVSIWHGLKMDIAMTSYVMMVYALIIALTFFLSGRYLSTIFRFFNGLFLALFLLVIVTDLEIYRNWGFHLDATPLQYLKTPKEAAASTPLSIYILMTALYALLLWGTNRVYKKLVITGIKKSPTMKFYYLPVFLFIGGAMVIPARGGVDVQPMNTSFVYHSSDIYANHVAVNPVWNFLYALDHLDNYDKNYDFIPNEEAQAFFNTMMDDEGETPQVLTTKQPNIILIILESFSSGLLDVPEAAVPNLNKYIQEGLYFENFYSNADRSDKGICALLSAYPAHPGDAVIKNSAKIEKMPNIGNALKDMGYYNSFYYGGDINFANMNSYLNISRFDQVITKLDFSSEYYGAKWGVHDGYVFDRFYEDISKQEQPFFNVMYSLSSHEPFDVPDEVIKGESIRKKFLNTALYTDKHLGLFVEKMRQSSLWDSTLIIITADHGSSFIERHKLNQKEKYHIPMIWLGGAIIQDSTISKYGSQTDLVATLLHQLDYPTEDFIFSKNLLSSGSNGFSYYTYRGGMGFLNDSTYQTFDLNSNSITTNEGNSDDEIADRVILQTSYNYFLNQ
jgi:phosphoglycerol transferase MdoB-like AlkP superfamily enzyme